MWGEGSEESEEKVIKHLSGRGRQCRITPLAASAFRSNWVLFRKIYDLYETRTKNRWTREEVRDNNGACSGKGLHNFSALPIL